MWGIQSDEQAASTGWRLHYDTNRAGRVAVSSAYPTEAEAREVAAELGDAHVVRCGAFVRSLGAGGGR
jgi:hypothetical protein